jgi:hypothetical protein
LLLKNAQAEFLCASTLHPVNPEQKLNYLLKGFIAEQVVHRFVPLDAQ